MKKIALGLVALAALSSTALAAGNRSWDLHDRQYYTTKGYVDGPDRHCRDRAGAARGRVDLRPFGFRAR